MPDELCPMCGTRRIGGFRYCLTCRFDFESPVNEAPTEPERRSRSSNSEGGIRLSDRPSVRLIAGTIAILAATLLGVAVVLALQMAGRI